MNALIFTYALQSLFALTVLIGGGLIGKGIWKERNDVKKIWAAIDELSGKKSS